MKITSADNICWISLELRGEPDAYAGIEMVSHVEIGHGRFEARNGSVHFLNHREFVERFDRFIGDRTLAPRLEGTYGTYIAFSGSGLDVMCEYCLGDAYAGRKTAEFFQSGKFEVERDSLLECLHGFRQVFSQYLG